MRCGGPFHVVASPRFHWGARLGRLLFCLVCVDPLPILLGMICVWIAAHLAGGFYQSLAYSGTHAHDLVGCGASLAALCVLVCLAGLYVIITLAAAWNRDSAR